MRCKYIDYAAAWRSVISTSCPRTGTGTLIVVLQHVGGVCAFDRRYKIRTLLLLPTRTDAVNVDETHRQGGFVALGWTRSGFKVS